MSLFNSHFEQVYGERWQTLLSALLSPVVRIDHALFEGFSTYRLDQASIQAARALNVIPGDSVLDMCAAPGGKTLILLECLNGKGQLTANEISFSRQMRLKEVIRTHVPEAHKQVVKVTGFDGNQFGIKKAESYDRILLDAPCSSERHLLEADPSMKEWKLSRTTQLAKRQYSLLCSAVLALKSGGTVVYSTCSISPFENDGVIERVLQRKSDQIAIDPECSDLSGLEKTKYGFQIFPDHAGGAGPMYISRLKKK